MTRACNLFSKTLMVKQLKTILSRTMTSYNSINPQIEVLSVTLPCKTQDS